MKPLQPPVTSTTRTGIELQFQPMSTRDLDAVMYIESIAHSHPWTRKNFEDSIRCGDQCWMAYVEQEIAAYSIISSGGGEAELLNHVVSPRLHQQGIGYALLKFILSRLEPGIDMVFLEVRKSNQAAIALYDRLGFSEVGVRPNYYPGKDRREDALIFAKPLGI
ncbi:MAG: ribosomal protein S18-alanine N-acetyltransferase [Exilibacterium sp.]